MIEPVSEPRLLLVDDNDMVRQTLGKVLSGAGFHVATASSVNEAIKLIGTVPFDALLSDCICRARAMG